jgi:hypothetical protein
MKATIDFDPTLYRALKIEAARSGTTIRELLDQAARLILRQRAEPQPPAAPEPDGPPPDMPWFGILRDKIPTMPASHDMAAVRESIARGRRAEWRERYGEP